MNSRSTTGCGVIDMKWLKDLFKKADIREYNIRVDQLFDWFITQSEPLTGEIKEEIRKKLLKIQTEIEMVQENLVSLNATALQNPHIPEKAKQIMQSNRENYVRHVQGFLSGLEVPKHPNMDEVSAFISRFEEQLVNLKKFTAKSYYVLKEFFANELTGIAKHINALDALVRDLHSPSYKQLGDIKKQIIQLENSLKNTHTLSSVVAQEKQSSNTLSGLIQATQEHIDDLKSSKAYKSLEDLQQQKQKLLMKLKHNETVLFSEFSPLTRPLKKYSHICLDGKELIDAYLENPFKALTEDKNFSILRILQDMKQNLQGGAVPLKDRELERAIEKINTISKIHLENLLGIHASLKEQLAGLDKRMLLNNVLREIEEQEYKLKHLKDKHERSQKNLMKLEQTTTREDVLHLRSVLEDKINELIDLPINIIINEKELRDEEAFAFDEAEKEGEESADEELPQVRVKMR